MGRAQHKRKRQRRRGPQNGRVGFKRFAATALILASAAGFAIETGRDSYSAQQPRSSTSIVGASTTTMLSTSTSTSTTLATSSTTTVPAPRIEDPFHSASLPAYLSTRTDNVTAALYDVTTNQTYIYRPGIRQVTASMVKIDILADLLFEAQNEHRALTSKEQNLAAAMIEQSDNKDAESLWVDIGQLPSITAFNDDLHFTQTITNWDWGFVDTTPRDQLQLLKAIVLPNKYLDPASQSYEQSLMENVADYERFGIPTGVPTNADVGVKNGWYPEKTTGWQINSAGYVKLGKTYYLAVVMTGSNPSEAYGKEVVNRVAQAFWNFESSRASQ
jgi:hypothetical protein